MGTTFITTRHLYFALIKPIYAILVSKRILPLFILFGLVLWFRITSISDISTFHTARASRSVTLKNGTYYTFLNEKHKQYQFLGIPYAAPPIGRLRFRPPQPFNESWHDPRNATEYSPMCIGYGGHTVLYPQREDCLTINVLAPAETSITKPLPVAVFIYGGGVHGGGSIDARYNLAFLASYAARNGIPFIAVAFNYRSSIWGFINSWETQRSGDTNIGIRDQRLALQWIQENIGAFGGDHNKVTLMGASSGADNVGLHLIAYGGRNDNLFRAAVLQSGSSLQALTGVRNMAQTCYDNLISSTNCLGAEDSLECLRSVPFDELNTAFTNDETTMAYQAFPVADGDLIQYRTSDSLKDNKFVKVPILIGITSNEAAWNVPEEIHSWEDCVNYLLDTSLYDCPGTVIERVLSFYSNTSRTERLSPPIRGIEDLDTYNRVEHILGDLEYNAAKRLQCSVYSSFTSCYSYRFDAVFAMASGNPLEGVRHGQEIPAVFQNVEGIGLDQLQNGNFRLLEVSKAIGLMWAGFITQLDPNIAFDGEPWPKYDVEHPQSLVFNEKGPFWTEEDTLRKNATEYINGILQCLGK